VVATPVGSPVAVAGAVTGPSGVPTAGEGSLETGSVTAKLLLVFGMLLGIAGGVSAVAATRKRV
jgi:hypothetical protein